MRRPYFLILALLTLAACTVAPTGTPYRPGPEATIWLAGDSIAGGVYTHIDSYLRIYDVAHGGNGFVSTNDGTIQSYTLERLEGHTPTTILVEGSTNDHWQDLNTVLTRMAEFEAELTSRGIQVIWLTTPVGTYQNLPVWLGNTNAWIRGRPNVIDCDTAEVRAAGTIDGIHPKALGYDIYGACINSALP